MARTIARSASLHAACPRREDAMIRLAGLLLAALLLTTTSARADTISVAVYPDATEEISFALTATWAATSNPSPQVFLTVKPSGPLGCAANYGADSANARTVFWKTSQPATRFAVGELPRVRSGVVHRLRLPPAGREGRDAVRLERAVRLHRTSRRARASPSRPSRAWTRASRPRCRSRSRPRSHGPRTSRAGRPAARRARPPTRSRPPTAKGSSPTACRARRRWPRPSAARRTGVATCCAHTCRRIRTTRRPRRSARPSTTSARTRAPGRSGR